MLVQEFDVIMQKAKEFENATFNFCDRYRSIEQLHEF